MVSRVSSNLFIKKSIRISAILIALLSVLCLLFVSCSEKQSKKEVFQIFREYDGVSFDVDEYIEDAKKKGHYVDDSALLYATEKTDGVIREFMINRDKELYICGAVYDSVENAKKAFSIFMEIEAWPCRSPFSSIVRIDNVVLNASNINDLVAFKSEIESILHTSVNDGLHELLYNNTNVVQVDTDKSFEEIVETIKQNGYDRVYHTGENLVCYKFLNKDEKAIEVYFFQDGKDGNNNMTGEKLISMWSSSYDNSKIVYSYKNGTLIAAIGVTVDPEPLLK